MARKEVVVKYCDRHGGSRAEATQTKRWAYDGETYVVDLCDQHAAAFDRDMGAWARISREVPDTSNWGAARPMLATRERDIDRASKRLASAAIVTPSMAGEVVVSRLPATFKLWSLTDHAKERCIERGITERDATLAACDPAYTFQHPDHRDTPEVRHHVRGGVAALVNTNTKRVITVMYASDTEGAEAIYGTRTSS